MLQYSGNSVEKANIEYVKTEKGAGIIHIEK